MFTGIITDIGRVLETQQEPRLTERRIIIETSYDTETIEIGSSIACSGVCLTVVQIGANWVSFDVSAETISKSTIAFWEIGSRVNLERSLSVGDELGGHLVSGHIDGMGELLSVTKIGSSVKLLFGSPRNLMKFIAVKGSISIDGVSLTVNEVVASTFCVNIIPHTLNVTTLGSMKPNTSVNLEVDLLARYVARQHEEEQYERNV